MNPSPSLNCMAISVINTFIFTAWNGHRVLMLTVGSMWKQTWDGEQIFCPLIPGWSLFHKQKCNQNSKLMEILFLYNQSPDDEIAKNCLQILWQHSYHVMWKFLAITFIAILMRTNRNFHQIWIVMENTLVKWVLGPYLSPVTDVIIKTHMSLDQNNHEIAKDIVWWAFLWMKTSSWETLYLILFSGGYNAKQICTPCWFAFIRLYISGISNLVVYPHF